MKVYLILTIALASPAFAQETIGICKGDAAPLGRVIVREFESPNCGPVDTKNAWDTAIATEGIEVCENPRARSAAANILQLVLCEKIESANCPLKKDGTSNAIVLRSPDSCLAKRGVRGEDVPKVAQLKLVCGVPDAKNGNDDHVHEAVVATVDPKTKACGSLPDGKGAREGFIVQQVDDWVPFVTCVQIGKDKRGVEHPPIGMNWAVWDVVQRRFRDKSCLPELELNAIVLWKWAGYNQEQPMGRHIPVLHVGDIVCDVSPWAGYMMVEIQIVEHTTQGGSATPVYDDDCGGPPDSDNAWKLEQFPQKNALHAPRAPTSH